MSRHCDGPRLPPNGAPNRVVLPNDGHANLEVNLKEPSPPELAEEETEAEEDDEMNVPNDQTVREDGEENVVTSDDAEVGKESLFCPHSEANGEEPREEDASGAPSFESLLAQVAMEHRRALEKVHRFYTGAEQSITADKRLRASKCPPPSTGGNTPRSPTPDRSPHFNLAPMAAFDEFQPIHKRRSSPRTTHTKSGRTSHDFGEKVTSFSNLRMEEYPREGRVSPFDLVSESSEVQRASGQVTSDVRRRVSSLMGWRLSEDFKEAAWRSFFRMETLDSMTSLAIVTNAIIFGWVADASLDAAWAGNDPDKVMSSIDRVVLPFTVWFCLELVVRIWHDGPCRFLCGEDWTWNAFDLLMVCIDLAQNILEPLMYSLREGSTGRFQTLTTVRMIRILRVVRAARVLRLLKSCSKLRVMVHSILYSGSALWWSLLLLGVAIYSFSVYFAQVVAYHLHDPDSFSNAESRQLMEEVFSSLLGTVYMLYRCISSGIEWGKVCDVLFEINLVHGFVFCFYMFFMMIAVLNIITGHFVQTSISSVRNSQDELAQEQLHLTQVWMQEMRKIFVTVDVNGSGTITMDELQDFLDREEVRAYLHALDIQIDKAKGLFQLLDIDMSGEITVEEFTFGCLRLRGGAKSIDMATLMNFVKRMGDQTRRFFMWSENQFRRLHAFQARVDQRLSSFEGQPTRVSSNQQFQHAQPRISDLLERTAPLVGM